MERALHRSGAARLRIFSFVAFLFATSVDAQDRNVPVVFGNEVLRSEQYAPLLGKRVAVLTNPTGVFSDSMVHIVDDMVKASLVNVVLVLSPEHGFRGDHQAETGDPLFYIDEPTQLPVFSAYKMSIQELSQILREQRIDVVLADMQDVGVRLYTFIWTMYNVMEAIRDLSDIRSPIAPNFSADDNFSSSLTKGIQFIITDRPNPLGGEIVDGPLIDMSCCSSGYGRVPIPFIHGMTIGELGLYFQFALGMSESSVQIVSMRNWHREMVWTTGASHFPPWVPPSPNIPTATTAQVYGATVFLEATSVSEGRGTTLPFELFGAPFLDAEDLAVALNFALHCGDNYTDEDRQGEKLSVLSEKCFRAAYYQPMWSKYNGTVVSGVQWFVGRPTTPRSVSYLRQSSGNSGGSTSSEFTRTVGSVAESAFAKGVRILCAIRDSSDPATAFVWDGSWFGHPGTELIDQYAGTTSLREMIDTGYAAEYILDKYKEESGRFAKERQKFLLYS